MPDWTNTVIYKIRCKDETISNMFIGYTTNLKKRRYAITAEYKSECKRSGHLLTPDMTSPYYVYQFIRHNGGIDNWTVEEVCKTPCETEDNAQKIKTRYISILGGNLNQYRDRTDPTQLSTDVLPRIIYLN